MQYTKPINIAKCFYNTRTNRSQHSKKYPIIYNIHRSRKSVGQSRQKISIQNNGKLGYSKTFINFIKKIYKNTQSVIANNGFLSTPLPFSKGVIQGRHHWGDWGPRILWLQRGLAISGKIYITNNAYSLSITII